MSNYNSLKATIDANIKQNGNQEITGQNLNSVLNQMVNILGTGYQFAGVATIDTKPGAPDAKVFYIANGKGSYTNFGGLEVTEDDVVVLYWDSSWHKVSTGIASQEKLTELDAEVKETKATLYGETRKNIEIVRGSGGIYTSGGAAPSKTAYGISEKFKVAVGDSLLYSLKTTKDYAIAVKSKYSETGAFLGYLPLDPPLQGTNDALSEESGEYTFSEDCEITLCAYTANDTPYSFVIKKQGASLDERISKLEIDKADKSTLSSLHVIGDFDANFKSPFDLSITGNKGEDTAQYDFNVPLKEKFNIRFKFRLTSDVYNGGIARNILKVNDVAILKATPVTMTQVTEEYTDENGALQISKWPAMNGGIKFLDSYVFDDDASSVTVANINNIGEYAISIKYLGDPSRHTVQVKALSGSFVIMVDGVVTSFNYDEYPTMQSLYEAINNLVDFECDYNELENRTPYEIVQFPFMSLVSRYHRSIDGGSQGVGDLVYYYDTAPLHIPYAISNKWHQAELSYVNGKYYLCVDGFFEEVALSLTSSTKLTFGGDCGVLFKDVEIDTDTPRDAEIKEYVWTIVSGGSQKKTTAFLSSVCPYIVLFEVHGMIEGSSGDATEEDKSNIQCSPDRIQYVHNILQQRGYVPITTKMITEWLNDNIELPKLCYSFMFDDWRWDNFLNLKKRSVFTRFGLKSALAIITNGSAQTIKYDGEEISKEKAIQIGANCGFTFHSHTYNHRKIDCRKPSDMASEFLQDIYNGDKFGIDPSIIIYPNGRNNIYSRNTMKFLGFAGGITVPRKYPIRKCTNKYSIPRIYLELNQTIDAVIGGLL